MLTRIFLIGVAAWLVAALLRYGLVEYAPAWTRCAAVDAPWWCVLRAAVLWGIGSRICEIVSLAAAALAALTRFRWFAVIALAAGVAGAVLYRFEFSAVGILAGALLMARAQQRA